MVLLEFSQKGNPDPKNIAPEILHFDKMQYILCRMDKEKLKKIGLYLLKGLTEKEACVLLDVPYAVFLKQKENDEPTRKFLEKQTVEFKLKHLEVIQKTSSEKTSMYLLEKLRPEEFGNKKGGEGPTINIISAIIQAIQNDPANSIITFTRGERKQDDKREIIKEGAALLN